MNRIIIITCAALFTGCATPPKLEAYTNNPSGLWEEGKALSKKGEALIVKGKNLVIKSQKKIEGQQQILEGRKVLEQGSNFIRNSQQMRLGKPLTVEIQE